MLLYSRSHSDEKRSEYAGKCAECGANLYWRDGKLVPDCKVEEGHLCQLEGRNDEAGKLS